jgi:hypothetical protein
LSPDFDKLLREAGEHDRTRLVDLIKTKGRESSRFYMQTIGSGNFGYTEVAVKLAQEMENGSRPAQEIEPLAPPDVFKRVEDPEPTSPQPALVHERQMITTTRDIESDKFSSCAAIVLYKERPDGTPEEATTFAHLPPKTDVTGGASSFESYTPDFLREQFGVTNFEGYKARVSSGINADPEAVTRTLRQLGADVISVEQIPLDMYDVRVDAKTKTIVGMGKPERLAREGWPVTYRTATDRIPIEILEDKMPYQIGR